MQNPIQQLLQEAVDLHRAGDLTSAATKYNQILNLEPNNAGVLFLVGDIAVRQGCNGLAITVLKASLSLKAHVGAYIALGCAYRAENFYDEACAAWNAANAIEPNAESFNNLASVYSDHGQPHKALGYIERALALAPPSPNVLWNRALALLTLQRWKEAWVDHENRFSAEVQSSSTRRNFGCQLWDGTPGKRLAIHG